MRLTKAQRAALHSMFNGHCAYCGEQLGERWHADHVDAVLRYGSGMDRAVNDRIENLMPSCAPCNLSKATYTLDQWRVVLAKHVESLNSYNTPYRLAKKYGLIVETAQPVVFYFERVAVQLGSTSPRRIAGPAIASD